jgi:hypothetical protein
VKHKKYKYKEQRVEDTFPIKSDHYNLLYDFKSEDTSVSTGVLRVIDSKHGRMDKMKYKSKVVIVGDSHTKECATEVKHLLTL